MAPDISGFLDDKKSILDRDPDILNYDDVRHYAYEGDGNTSGSLSSLASCEYFWFFPYFAITTDSTVSILNFIYDTFLKKLVYLLGITKCHKCFLLFPNRNHFDILFFTALHFFVHKSLLSVLIYKV